MRGAKDIALLGSVCLLLVVVLAATQTGPPPGSSYYLPGWLSPPPATGNQSTQVHRSTTYQVTTGQGHSETVTSTKTSSGATTTKGSLPVPPPTLSSSLAWYLLVPLVIGLGTGMAMLLLRRQDPRIFDLKGMVEELDPHSAYLPAQDFSLFQSETEGKFGGVGIAYEGKIDRIAPHRCAGRDGHVRLAGERDRPV
jgi:hypothetical protein